MATIEALAGGTPVVGTPVGATPELLAPLDERLLAAGTMPPTSRCHPRGPRPAHSGAPRALARARARAPLLGSRDPGLGARARAAASAATAAARKGAVVRAASALDRRVPVDLKAARDGLVAQARETTGLAVRRAAFPRTQRLGGAPRAGILLYHNPEPETSNGTSTISPSDTVLCRTRDRRAVRTRDWSEVPPKSLAVTFDDGHAGNAA